MNSNINKKITLFATTLGSFITPFIGSSINVALPSIAKDFSMNAIELSWVTASYLLASAIFLIPFGKAADIYGRKQIFLYGIIAHTIASFLTAIAVSSSMLILCRIIHGVGSAMIMSTAIAILISVFPQEERGRIIGINVAAVYAGLSMGPFIGGLLTQHFGWRSIFAVNIPIGLLIIIFVVWKFNGEQIETKAEKFDFAGSFIYGLSLASLIYGFSILPSLNGISFIVVSLLGFILFVLWENKTINPVLNIEIFKNNSVFTFSNIAALINYSATFSVSFILSLYLQYVKGFTPQHAGLILVSQPVIQAVLSPFAGRLSDKIEPRIVASAGMGLTAVGLFSLIFLNASTSSYSIIVILALLGLGFAFFSSPNTNAIMSSVEKRFYGSASATLNTMRLTGQMMGIAVVMFVFSTYLGTQQIEQNNIHLFLASIKTAFIISSAACFLGIFTSLARGKLR